MRRQKTYFETEPGAPPPVQATVRHRVSFSEVDAMAIAWHGRYLQFFEKASEALGRLVGLSYEDYREAGLRGPVVQAHVDYYEPAVLAETLIVTARWVWCEATRLDTEYTVLKENGRIGATGYTVQMFTDGETGEPRLTDPPILEQCRRRWRDGAFH